MIVVDVETTGLDPEKSAILSIGAVDFVNPSYQFHGECRAWPGAIIDEESLKINGFTIQRANDNSKQSIEDLILKFIKWADVCSDLTLAGHNVGRFDAKFLYSSLNVYNSNIEKSKRIRWPFGYRSRDLHTTCCDTHDRLKMPLPYKERCSSVSMDYVLGFVGLPPEPKPHLAINGAKLEAEAFSRLIFSKNLLPEYSQHQIPLYLR